jgi:hypothetical protein
MDIFQVRFLRRITRLSANAQVELTEFLFRCTFSTGSLSQLLKSFFIYIPNFRIVQKNGAYYPAENFNSKFGAKLV